MMKRLDPALTPDRRSFIGGAGLAAVAVTVRAVVVAAKPSRVAWDAAVANLAQRQAEMDVSLKAYNQTEARYFDSRPARLTIEDLFEPPSDDVETFRVRVDALRSDRDRQDALARRQSGHVHAERLTDIAMNRHTAALDALLLCPAPDLAAVAYKLEEAKRNGMDMFSIDGIVADIRRMVGSIA